MKRITTSKPSAAEIYLKGIAYFFYYLGLYFVVLGILYFIACMLIEHFTGAVMPGFKNNLR
jgi:hypothetical protein